MAHRLWFALAVVALSGYGTAVATAAEPAVITFGNATLALADHGPLEEGGFRYVASGESWNTQLGPPFIPAFPTGHALVTFWGVPVTVGQSVTFTRPDRETFTFNSVDIRGRLEGQRNDVVEVLGFLDGARIARQTLQSSTEAWATRAAVPEFATPIDELRLVLVERNGSALIVDNVRFNAIPEPTMLAAALPFALLTRRRRSA